MRVTRRALTIFERMGYQGTAHVIAALKSYRLSRRHIVR